MATYTVDILTYYQYDTNTTANATIYFKGICNGFQDDTVSIAGQDYIYIGATYDPDSNQFNSIEQAIEFAYAFKAGEQLGNYNVGLLSGDTFVLGNRYDYNASVGYAYENLLRNKFNVPTGSTSQYIRGDGSLQTFPTIPSVAQNQSPLILSLVGTGATGTQISSSKPSLIAATVTVSSTSLLLTSASSSVALKICATNNATEASWTTITTANSNLSGVAATNGNTQQLIAEVPAGWYVKLVNSGTGTHSEAFVSAQQTIYG